MRLGLLQLQSSDDPVENLPTTLRLFENAAQSGADFVATPEVTNLVSTSRRHQGAVLTTEEDDTTLAGLREATSKAGIWALIGSLALKSGNNDDRFVNRSFLIGPNGQIVTRYDKIHMFDVTISETESYRESNSYRPGSEISLSHTPMVNIGMTICYDLRFPRLFRLLAQAGAQVIFVPSAFAPATGQAHWEVLLRARAIENGCYIVAPAQWGDHNIRTGTPRRTHGHSCVVDPWGEIVECMPDGTGVLMADIDLEKVIEARTKIPSLQHDRPIGGSLDR